MKKKKSIKVNLGKEELGDEGEKGTSQSDENARKQSTNCLYI